MIRSGDQLRITDPMFEYWLAQRGLNGQEELDELR